MVPGRRRRPVDGCGGVYDLTRHEERVRLVLSGVDRRTRRVLLEVVRRWHGGDAAAAAVERDVRAHFARKKKGRRQGAPQ